MTIYILYLYTIIMYHTYFSIIIQYRIPPIKWQQQCFRDPEQSDCLAAQIYTLCIIYCMVGSYINISYIYICYNTILYPSDKVTAAVFSWSRTKWLSCRQNCKNPVCSSHETRSPIKTQTCHAQNLSEEDSVQISQKGRRGGVWFFRFEPKPYCHAQICWGCANLSTIGEGAHSDTNMYHCR